MLSQEIAALRRQLAEVSRKVDQKLINQRVENAVGKIANQISQFMPSLDNDHPTDRAELVVENLTLRNIGEEGESFLWSIGSGSNHLSYHIAAILAMHLYFLSLTKSPVPGLLVLDQPSQVYFPERTALDPNTESIVEAAAKDKDDYVRGQAHSAKDAGIGACHATSASDNQLTAPKSRLRA